MHKWTDEEICFLRETAPGRSYSELHKLVQNRFNIHITKDALKGTLGRYGICNGINRRFAKGVPSHNKGKKGVIYPGTEKSWFQKGNRPWNYKPIGTERINADGYAEIKTADPNVWTAKHLLLWEKHNGKVPSGHVVVITGENRISPQIDDLILISRKELAVINKRKLKLANRETAETGKLLADLIIKKSDVQKQTKRKNK